MNPKYYVNAEECEKARTFLNKYSVGGGVVGGEELTYLGGPVAVPQIEGKLLFHLKLANGADLNAGLVFDLFSKGYSEASIAERLQYEVRNATPKKDE